MKKVRIGRRVCAFLLSLILLFGLIPAGSLSAAESVSAEQQKNAAQEEHTVDKENVIEPEEIQKQPEENKVQDSPEEAGSKALSENGEETEEDAGTGAEETGGENRVRVLDASGNILEADIGEPENSQELLEKIDFSRVSGERIWFQDISVKEYSGAVTVEIPIEHIEEPEEKLFRVVSFRKGGGVQYSEAELSDENVISFELSEPSAAAVYAAEDLYHYSEDDLGSVIKWRETYLPDGYEELLNYDESWWDSLYDYERDMAEFLKGLIVELSPNVYTEQELSECISILENGTSPEDFFAGTVFEGLELSDLYELRESGGKLEDFLCQDLEAAPPDTIYQETSMSGAGISAYSLNEGEPVARMAVSYTGYSGTGHGKIYKLSVGGQPAFCLNMGKSARNAFLYKVGPGEYEEKKDGIGMLISLASSGVNDYVCVQIAIWLYQTGTSYGKTEVLNRVAAMLDITTEEEVESMASTVWAYYSLAKTNSRTYYILKSENGNAQNTGTKTLPPGTPYTPETPTPPPGDTSILIKIVKADWQTEVGLEGCVVDILENGVKIASVTTDGSGQASYTVHKSESEAKGKSFRYSIGEITAPNGYVWQENSFSKTAGGGGTIEFTITNERTLGKVELIKYDTESESGTKQGDAVLDGAVYGIYAAEDIEHQDKVTGTLYKKDELVAEAVVGKSPRLNAEGYVLNTDGSRHIEYPGKKIAYQDTPGRTLFGDLELGSYYIREISPSEGYMLDEAVYDVTVTYKDQTIKIEDRDETAGEADNELTADDGSSSAKVYSGDYVIKQGIQFIKTSDNTYQTELEPIEGAGFCVYLISDLSGVKDGSIRPVGDAWGADDIMTFYDYDFTGEPTATVYKRTNHEEWTVGDTLWLRKADGLNKYQVAEMFTDKDGRIETPELPYGTYVFVETTTPEHHAAAKPFIAYITQDGGVLYTDETKQNVEKVYTPEEAVRYGDHKNTKEREGRALQKQRFVNNTITKAFLRIVKADREFLVKPGTYIEAEETVRGTVLKEGSSYRLRCLTMDLSRESLTALNWKYDAEGYMSYYDPNAKLMTGTAEHPFMPTFLRRSGKIADCYITLPQEIPIGTYELTELTAPGGYVVNGSEQTVKDTGEGRVNGYEIVDTPWKKMTFTINNGSVYPDGQMGTDKYAVCDRYGNLTVTVLQENQEQKGIIRVYKHGEQLAGAGKDKLTLLDKLKNEPFRYLKLEEEAKHRDAVFVYHDAPVEGASFRIVAAEDIYTQELRKDLFDDCTVDESDYLIYHEGDTVAEITTDRHGWGYASGLYIGKYRMEETVAGSGFVLNTEVTEFEITPQEQTVNFDIHDAIYKNERQRLEIHVEKSDLETGEALAGAVYGLYAGEDICTDIIYNEKKSLWEIRDVPQVLFPEGSLIATCITDETGKAFFDEDLPLAKYVVRELEAPLGYWGAAEDIPADGSYGSVTGGQNVEIQRLKVHFENQKTRVLLTKHDLTNGAELEGAELEIREVAVSRDGLPMKKGASYVAELKDSWVSRGPGKEVHYFYEEDGYLIKTQGTSRLPAGKKRITKEGHLIEGLQPGRIYILRETKAAAGYVTADEILFRLEEKMDGTRGQKSREIIYSRDGTVWETAADDIVLMEDDVTKLEISKKDITTGKELPGATLEIYDAEGKLMTSWVSTDTPHYIERLPVGRYRLVEKKNPSGYGYAEEIEFEITDQTEIHRVTMYDDRETVDVEKSAPAHTKRNAFYSYTIDEIRNLTDDSLDDFTMTDTLPPQVRITELWTGTYDQELSFDVEYQLNGSSVWTTWASGLNTKISTYLTAPLQDKDTYITKFRFCFGTVGARFSREEKPVYMVRTLDNASGKIVNHIEVTAEHHGIPVKDKDETVTTTDGPSGHKNPDEPKPAASQPEVTGAAFTGDDAPVLPLAAFGIFLGLGIVYLLHKKREDHQKG